MPTRCPGAEGLARSADWPELGKGRLGLQGKSARGKGWWGGGKEPAPGGGQFRGGRPHPPGTQLGPFLRTENREVFYLPGFPSQRVVGLV